jgi:hypothetical protein
MFPDLFFSLSVQSRCRSEICSWSTPTCLQISLRFSPMPPVIASLTFRHKAMFLLTTFTSCFGSHECFTPRTPISGLRACGLLAPLYPPAHFSSPRAQRAPNQSSCFDFLLRELDSASAKAAKAVPFISFVFPNMVRVLLGGSRSCSCSHRFQDSSFLSFSPCFHGGFLGCARVVFDEIRVRRQ